MADVEFTVGQLVDAKFKGRSKWYAAKVIGSPGCLLCASKPLQEINDAVASHISSWREKKTGRRVLSVGSLEMIPRIGNNAVVSGTDKKRRIDVQYVLDGLKQRF